MFYSFQVETSTLRVHTSCNHRCFIFFLKQLRRDKKIWCLFLSSLSSTATEKKHFQIGKDFFTGDDKRNAVFKAAVTFTQKVEEFQLHQSDLLIYQQANVFGYCNQILFIYWSNKNKKHFPYYPII